MGPLTDKAFIAATEQGAKLAGREPRAQSASYDPATGRIVLELVNGCAYVFPAVMVQDLAGASADQLAVIEVDGMGFNLHWPALDVDLYVPAVVAGLFGTEQWMASQLARVAGRATTPAKAAAARANGAKGGRPRKLAKA